MPVQSLLSRRRHARSVASLLPALMLRRKRRTIYAPTPVSCTTSLTSGKKPPFVWMTSEAGLSEVLVSLLGDVEHKLNQTEPLMVPL